MEADIHLLWHSSQGGGEIEVRNFSQFSAISQFFAIFRNFSQFSAIFPQFFRNFSHFPIF